jgi:RNA polymerase sigma factor (sigma-70 family)
MSAAAAALSARPLSRRQAAANGRPRENRRVSLLNGSLELGDVENVESLARRVLDDRLRASNAYLNPTEYEDALSYLVAEAWVLSTRHDPEKGTASFSTYAYRILWRRVASWYRQRFGDTRYRVKPTWVSLDDNDLDEIAADWEWEEPADQTLYQRINVDALSPESRKIFEKVARPMVEEDLSLEQIAGRLGRDRRWVSRALDRLRAELGPIVGLPS